MSHIPRFIATLCIVGSILLARSPAQTPVLVKDINSNETPVGSSPESGRNPYGSNTGLNGDYVQLGKTWFFTADDGIHGRELWRTDGTSQGTMLFKDLTPGPSGSEITLMTLAGDKFFFVVKWTLWVSDGTRGGTRPTTLNFSYQHRALWPLGNRVLVVPDANQMWITDGTQKGTSRIGSVPRARHFAELDAKTALFSAGGQSAELWRTDGTSSGTRLVKDINPGPRGSNPRRFRRFKGSVLFTATHHDTGEELWRTDGTAKGTVPVKNIEPIWRRGSNPSLDSGIEFGGDLYFSAGSSRGNGMWKTDGTTKGTVFVAPVGIKWPTLYKGRIYFSGIEVGGKTGQELWVSDGSSAGTKLVVDLHAGPASSEPRDLRVVGGKLIFAATRPDVGHELFVSDGSANGTRLLLDLHPYDSGVLWHRHGFTRTGQNLVFVGRNHGTRGDGYELFTTNGTARGTGMLKNIRRGTPADADIHDLCDHHGVLFFAANDGQTGSEIWKSDRTSAGTVLVKDIAPTRSSTPRGMTSYNGEVYFSAYTIARGIELWKTDGTSAGTRMLADLRDGTRSSDPRDFTVVRDMLFFTALAGANARPTLFVTDGTRVGIRDLAPSPVVDMDAQELAEHDGKLYFAGRMPFGDGIELCVSDGTHAGTKLVKDIYPGGASSFPRGLLSFRGKLYFVATTKSGPQLFVSDGTTLGTKKLDGVTPKGVTVFPPLAGANGYVFFQSRDARGGTDIWSSDGTASGTRRVVAFDRGRFVRERLVPFGDRIVFAGNRDGRGREPWASDGTVNGTRRIADLAPGSAGSEPRFGDSSRGALYFAATTPRTGHELFVWKTSYASARKLGRSCGASNPTLRATTPILGTTMHVTGTGPAAHPGLVLFNLPSSPRVLAGCLDYVNALRAHALAPVTGPTYRLPLPLANHAAFVGVVLNLQAWFLTVPTLLPVHASNAVQLTLGR